MTITVSPFSEDLIRRYDVSGPRYTSYPTADRFVEAFRKLNIHKH
jgi:oxygen-independent coproporphyrinogen-3 oxidase